MHFGKSKPDLGYLGNNSKPASASALNPAIQISPPKQTLNIENNPQNTALKLHFNFPTGLDKDPKQLYKNNLHISEPFRLPNQVRRTVADNPRVTVVLPKDRGWQFLAGAEIFMSLTDNKCRSLNGDEIAITTTQ